MGSWSVYCSISKIAIRAGQECVFIPLKKNEKYSYSYLNYVPATLPIFGEYDDYGGVENIVKNENTKFIEDHFKVTIEDFVEFFTRGIHSPGEGKEILIENEEIKSWCGDDEVLFMFIDRKVWDFMSTNTFKEDRGRFNFDDKEILKIFGVDNQKNKLKGKFFYEFKDFIKAYDVDKSKHYLRNRIDSELYEYFSEKTLIKNFSYLIGVDRNSSMLRELQNKLKELSGEPIAPEEESIADKYCANIQKFAKQFSELEIFRTNLYPMSGDFEPYVPYLTPQCGEIHQHQILLKEFAKINKSYCDEEKDD